MLTFEQESRIRKELGQALYLMDINTLDAIFAAASRYVDGLATAYSAVDDMFDKKISADALYALSMADNWFLERALRNLHVESIDDLLGAANFAIAYMFEAVLADTL